MQKIIFWSGNFYYHKLNILEPNWKNRLVKVHFSFALHGTSPFIIEIVCGQFPIWGKPLIYLSVIILTSFKMPEENITSQYPFKIWAYETVNSSNTSEIYIFLLIFEWFFGYFRKKGKNNTNIIFSAKNWFMLTDKTTFLAS